MRILIVDDSKIARQVMKKLLRQIGHEDVVEAGDGRDALAIAASEPVDLIISDWHMPAMDGLSFVRALRETCSRKAPVIVVSSESDPNRIVEIMQAGARAYILKPFTAEALRRKILEVDRVERLAEQSASAASALSGDLAEVAFPEVVQFLATARMSGALRISTRVREGTIEFREGEVRAARDGVLRGDEAFFALADVDEGRFRFEGSREPLEASMSSPTLPLLIEAMRRRDERQSG
jgi:two-component system chemotaxis response regulator CheY